MPRKKKREELEEDNFLDEVDAELDDEELDEEAEDEEVAEEEDADEEAASDDEDSESASEEEEQAEEKEEEIDYPPDDKKAVAALEKLSVRLDVTEKGNVWRVIFDDSNGKDPALVLLDGLPALKEVWLLGTKVTDEAAEKFKEDHPKMTVYH